METCREWGEYVLIYYINMRVHIMWGSYNIVNDSVNSSSDVSVSTEIWSYIIGYDQWCECEDCKWVMAGWMMWGVQNVSGMEVSPGAMWVGVRDVSDMRGQLSHGRIFIWPKNLRGKGRQRVTLEAKGSRYGRWICPYNKSPWSKRISVPTKPSFHLFQSTFWGTHPARRVIWGVNPGSRSTNCDWCEELA